MLLRSRRTTTLTVRVKTTLLLLVISCLTSASEPPEYAKMPVFGFVTVFGESVGVPGYEHDDWGPRPEVLAELISRSGATCVLVGTCGGTWRFTEKSDPGHGHSEYDWRAIDASTDPFLSLGLLPISFFFLEGPDWIEDEFGSERWEKLADRFSEAFVRRSNEKGIFHFIFENEPNLLARKDWPDYYMRKLKVFHRAAKRGDSRNMVIAGNLSERAATAGHFDLLYDRGFSDFCDIVGHHPYNNDPSKGLDMDDVVCLRKVMERRGDAGKQIFLGEGWGPKRGVPGVPRPYAGLVPTRGEIETLEAFLVNGYRELMKPREGWDAKWLFGAFFFTLNDNVGGRHWAARGKPLNGGVLIDGYYIPKEAPKPVFYNGGLADIWGQPKGDVVYRFPDGNARPIRERQPTTVKGENLLAYAHFERWTKDGFREGWQLVGGNETSFLSRDAGREAGFSLKLGSEAADFDIALVTKASVEPGKEYSFRGWIGCAQTRIENRDPFVTVGHDVTGQTADAIKTLSLVWSPNLAAKAQTAGEWFAFERVFRAESAFASVWIRCGNRGGKGGFFVKFDDVEIREIVPEGE